MVKVLLVGYIGQKNFGDDLLFEIAINELKDIPNVEIHTIVVGNNLSPDYLYNYFPKLKIVRFESKVPLLFYRNYDKVYFIGGGIFFDYKESVDLPSYTKRVVSNFIRFNIPKLLGTRFGGLGIGLGPYYCERAKTTHKKIITLFDILGVRDQVSYDIAKSMGVKNLYLTNDLSLKLFGQLQELQVNESPDSLKEIILCPRAYSHNKAYENHLEELLKFADILETKNYKVHWVFLQDDNLELVSRIGKKQKVTIWEPFTMSIIDFISLFKKASLVVTSRMHSIFIAGMVETPFIAIPVHEKLVHASNLFYKDPAFVHPTATIEEYLKAFDEINKKVLTTEHVVEENKTLSKASTDFKKWLEK